VIRNEACFRARVSPWRRIEQLEPEEALRVVRESEWIMRRTLASGRRPSTIYKPPGRRCPRCGGEVSSRGQGDANRVAYWCMRCQQ
jgi:formamidopyrimidine-DNA glycosylase